MSARCKKAESFLGLYPLYLHQGFTMKHLHLTFWECLFCITTMGDYFCYYSLQHQIIEFFILSSKFPNADLLIFWFTWLMFFFHLLSDYDDTDTFWLLLSLYLFAIGYYLVFFFESMSLREKGKNRKTPLNLWFRENLNYFILIF